MTKRTVRARQAALPETRRELDDPVVVIGEKIAAAIAAIDHKDQQPACATTERDGLALSDYLAAFEIAIYSVIDVLYRETGRDPKTLGCDYYAGVNEGVTDRLRPITLAIEKRGD